MEKQHTLYLLGGLQWTGKSDISREIGKAIPSTKILHTDDIRDCIKEIIRFGPSQIPEGSSKNLTLNICDMEITKEVTRDDGKENDYGWLFSLETIDICDQQNKSDIVVEGVAVTTDLIRGLRLKNLNIKIALLGFNDPSYAKILIDHLETTDIENHMRAAMRDSNQSPKQFIEEAMSIMVRQSNILKQEVKDDEYFDVTKLGPFDARIKTITDTLLRH